MLPILFIPAFLVVYALLVVFTSLFWGGDWGSVRDMRGRSALIIIGASLCVLIVVRALGNEYFGWANRALHALGGGAMAVLVCYLAMKDARIAISRFQFFAFSFLLATAMGTANELLEFFLQTTVGIMFAPTITDTWLDLTSNTVGMLCAGAIATVFWGQRRATR